jgi:hypothetical protein
VALTRQYPLGVEEDLIRPPPGEHLNDPEARVPGPTPSSSRRPCRTRQRRAIVRARRWRRGQRRERGHSARRRGHGNVARTSYIHILSNEELDDVANSRRGRYHPNDIIKKYSEISIDSCVPTPPPTGSESTPSCSERRMYLRLSPVIVT